MEILRPFLLNNFLCKVLLSIFFIISLKLILYLLLIKSFALFSQDVYKELFAFKSSYSSYGFLHLKALVSWALSIFISKDKFFFKKFNLLFFNLFLLIKSSSNFTATILFLQSKTPNPGMILPLKFLFLINSPIYLI